MWVYFGLIAPILLLGLVYNHLQSFSLPLINDRSHTLCDSYVWFISGECLKVHPNVLSAFSIGRFSGVPHWPVLVSPRMNERIVDWCVVALSRTSDF